MKKLFRLIKRLILNVLSRLRKEIIYVFKPLPINNCNHRWKTKKKNWEWICRKCGKRHYGPLYKRFDKGGLEK